MATITIRNVDDDVYERLKKAAKGNHRSVEAEIRSWIEERDNRLANRRRLLEELRKVRIPTGPDYEGSVALIRAIRDEE
jgi:plasmid stability protein